MKYLTLLAIAALSMTYALAADISSICGKEIRYEIEPGASGNSSIGGYQLVTNSPVTIKEIHGGRSTINGEVWFDKTNPINDISMFLESEKWKLDYCKTTPQNCSGGFLASHQKAYQWLQCVVNNSRSGGEDRTATRTAGETPRIANCPPALPQSCAMWSIYDRQLNWWNVKNNCSKSISITFAGDQGREDTQVFGPGETFRVTSHANNAPKYIVWDAMQGLRFYRDQPADAALKCMRSMPF